jgi:hypothetical protein
MEAAKKKGATGGRWVPAAFALKGVLGGPALLVSGQPPVFLSYTPFFEVYT